MKKKKIAELRNRFIFLGITVIITVTMILIDSEKTISALKYSTRILLKILPILIIVLVIMTLVDYFLKKDKISNLLGIKSGIKGFSIAAFSGIISHGPIFAWYPMLNDLRKSGMSIGLVAVFLYTRAIKLPLIPLLLLYFGWKFVLIWFFYMILVSFLLGKIMDITI